MKIPEIYRQLDSFKSAGKTFFTTCSFQSHSLVLLHLLVQYDKSIPVYFLNTGYHFPETLLFRDQIAAMLGIRITDLIPGVSKSQQRDSEGNLLFTFDPDYCCYLNKVQPIEQLSDRYDVWINGIRADQNRHRKSLKTIEATGHRAVRFHPLLDWDENAIMDYLSSHKLPPHPLQAKGYSSIGCEPCTRPAKPGEDRDGRWFGLHKTECGLNTSLLEREK